jgi:hypothetical protein
MAPTDFFLSLVRERIEVRVKCSTKNANAERNTFTADYADNADKRESIFR